MNDLSSRIRDIHLPEADFWWPPAPGWWLLGAGLLLTAGLLMIRHRRRTALRRVALERLEEIRARHAGDGDSRRLAMELNLLLRRVAMARCSREEVASLHGEQWLELLDRLGGGHEFREGAGRRLLELPYDPRAEGNQRALLDLVERWLRRVA